MHAKETSTHKLCEDCSANHMFYRLGNQYERAIDIKFGGLHVCAWYMNLCNMIACEPIAIARLPIVTCKSRHFISTTLTLAWLTT